MPVQPCLPSLMAALSDLADLCPRRGVRHPFSAILGLTLLGLICRRNDFAGLRRLRRNSNPPNAAAAVMTRANEAGSGTPSEGAMRSVGARDLAKEFVMSC